MKNFNSDGFGLSAMIGFMIAFVLFLIFIVYLAHRVGI